MTNKEAADLLEIEKMFFMCCLSPTCPPSQHDSDMVEAYDMAINALNMSTEQKEVVGFNWANPLDGYEGRCPTCGRTVSFSQKYCQDCAQPLSWPAVSLPDYSTEEVCQDDVV